MKQLEEAGLVLRRVDPHDNRFTLVSLTPEGRQLVAALIAAGASALQPSYRPIKLVRGPQLCRTAEAAEGPVQRGVFAPQRHKGHKDRVDLCALCAFVVNCVGDSDCNTEKKVIRKLSLTFLLTLA
jgi:DNA-binding MarR family transcriptional regulator